MAKVSCISYRPIIIIHAHNYVHSVTAPSGCVRLLWGSRDRHYNRANHLICIRCFATIRASTKSSYRRSCSHEGVPKIAKILSEKLGIIFSDCEKCWHPFSNLVPIFWTHCGSLSCSLEQALYLWFVRVAILAPIFRLHICWSMDVQKWYSKDHNGTMRGLPLARSNYI